MTTTTTTPADPKFPTTRSAAIAAQCRQCCNLEKGQSLRDIRECQGDKARPAPCPLFPFRPGQRSRKPKEASQA